MTLHFNGGKDPSRRAYVESHPDIPFQPGVTLFRAYRKTTLTYAAKVSLPFEVDTLEGLHTGNAGDYLAVGVHGEMYPIEAAVFETTYEET